MYKIIIFDIDGTIVRHISSWQYIHEKLGLWENKACIYQKKFLEGKISYKRFCELDAVLWKGIPERKIRAIFKILPYSKNVIYCIRRLKKIGFKLAAISTGLQYIPERIKSELGFDYVLCNKLISKRDILTGEVEINITHGAKAKALKKILNIMHIRPKEAISVGDSAGDIPLARISGYSIAFNSNDKIFSRIVDYNCKTKDFKEVFEKIICVCR